MTDYVKSTNFASKDSLAVGNPLKIVKGTEIDTEFNNIATAVATKADLNSPTFIGTPSAPTASAGTNTTQLATTAFVQAAMQALHPVGSIYINATNSANPATLLGFGTWSAFGAGRVPVGFDNGNALFNAAEKTGGSYDAALVSHTHTWSGSATTGGQSNTHTHGANTLASGNHKHIIPIGTGTNQYSLASSSGGTWPSAVNGNTTTISETEAAGSHTHSISVDNASADHTHNVSMSGTTSSSGSSATNANVQPYITVYMWKRTA